MPIRAAILISLVLAHSAAGQVFLSAQGGAAAISNGAAVSASPVAASSYDSKPGAAFALAGGFLVNDWIGAEAVYSANRNRLLTSEVSTSLTQREFTVAQHSWAVEAMLYFRPRTSRIRPYLSAGPALVRARSRSEVGLRVAVGVDLLLSRGWGFRYSFSEVMSDNPLATDLRPPIGGKLLNFQNQFGIVKVFR